MQRRGEARSRYTRSGPHGRGVRRCSRNRAVKGNTQPGISAARTPPRRTGSGLDTAAWMPPLKSAGCRLAAEGSAAPLAATAAHSGGDALDSALGGGGSRGRGACRIAGGGEGEGGESMPDAETSPLPPDEPPAETSIEG